MDTPAQIGELAKQLSAADQDKILKLIQSLLTQSAAMKPMVSLGGLWTGCPPITEEDIAANRKDMFRNFPRADI